MSVTADPYQATWVSHTSINDFLQCPRAYYLNNVYKDPKTGHKIQLMSPALALGQIVHGVLENLSNLPTASRFKESLIAKFEKNWAAVSGLKGGFFDESTEQRYQERGRAMLQRVMNHPGPLANLAVKIKADLPHFWLSEADQIILCGKIDWLEYLPDQEGVKIIDFKTGLHKESANSWQLPIYHLLVHYCQHRPVLQAAYWYLATDDELEVKELPVLEEAESQILQIAKKIKLARQLQHFKCPHGADGCPACRPLEKIIRGEAKFVGESEYRQDVYVLPPPSADQAAEETSVLL